MSKLNGKTALITGGNSGIGLATARLFIAEGARVAITGRDETTLAAAVAELGESAFAVSGDIAVATDRARVFETIKDRFGSLDIVFANAGIATVTPLGKTEESAFRQVMDVNVTSVFFTVQDALNLLNDRASIILNGSVIAVLGSPGRAAYAASKAAVRSMARVLAAELSPRSIRVNVVVPGATDTPIWGRSMNDQQVATLRERLSTTVPLGRMGEADEIARAVLFLASDDSSYVQGAELVVDGGATGLPAGTPARRG